MGNSPTSTSPDQDPLLGRVISERYRIIKRLGEGGMGSVYLAEHVLIEKRLALKVMFPDVLRRSDLVARFLQEARSASRIGHENVIDISDFGQSPEGLVFIAMEYLEGVSLAQLLRSEGPLPWPRACSIAEQICKGLRAAHARGIVHRDVKPENVFITQREDHPEFVKVLDFGIAKVVGQASGLTQTGVIFGTPEYMAPEQALGSDADHRVDVYALGCMLYQMLTGEPPFKAETFMAVLTKQMTEAPQPPRQLRPDLDIPPEAEGIVLRAMEKNREQRYPDMGSMLAALEAATVPSPDRSAQPESESMTFEPIPEPEKSSHLTWVILAALALAGATTGILILRTTGGHPTRIITEPARAIRQRSQPQLRSPSPPAALVPPSSGQPPVTSAAAAAPPVQQPPVTSAAVAVPPAPVAASPAPSPAAAARSPGDSRPPGTRRTRPKPAAAIVPPPESTSPSPVDPELKNPF